MAEGTRMRSLEESVKKMELQLQEINQFVAMSRTFMNSTQEVMNETTRKLDEHQSLIETSQQKIEARIENFKEVSDQKMESLANSQLRLEEHQNRMEQKIENSQKYTDSRLETLGDMVRNLTAAIEGLTVSQERRTQGLTPNHSNMGANLGEPGQGTLPSPNPADFVVNLDPGGRSSSQELEATNSRNSEVFINRGIRGPPIQHRREEDSIALPTTRIRGSSIDGGVPGNRTIPHRVATQLGANQDTDVQAHSWGSGFKTGNYRTPKLDFPVFEGLNPRSWIRKAEKYFRIFAIGDSDKIEIAMMYMNGKADIWAQGWLLQNQGLSWQEFGNAVCVRFGEKQGAEVVEEFNKLMQADDIEDYNEKFEELRACMLAYNPTLPETYFICSYISGLKEEIKSLVKMGKPDSLVMAFEQARLHYGAVQTIVKLSKPPWNPPSSNNLKLNSLSNASACVLSNDSSNKAGRQSIENQRTLGLCYRCGDKYYVGHRCKTQSLHSLAAAEIEDVQSAGFSEIGGRDEVYG